MKDLVSGPDYAPLWSWIREREAIRVKKEELRLPPPWTTDPILAAYRFCNVRREDDRGTRWIAAHVRTPFADHPMLWFMLCICRQINWPSTLAELIGTEGAWPSHVNFTPARLGEALRARQKRGEKVYTGAYMIPAPAEHGADKQAHIAEVVLGDLHRRAPEFGRGADWSGRTLQATHALIRRSSGWGPFLAYQAVVDMRFSEQLLEHRHGQRDRLELPQNARCWVTTGQAWFHAQGHRWRVRSAVQVTCVDVGPEEEGAL